MIRKIYLMLLTTALFLQGCTKKDSVPGRINLLTGREWKLSGTTCEPAIPLSVQGSVYSYTNLFDYYEDSQALCFKERTLLLKEGTPEEDYQQGEYSYLTYTDCSRAPGTQTGTWGFLTNNDAIHLYLYKDRANGLVNSIYKVEEISGNRLVLSDQARYSGSSTVFTFRYVFSAK